ncbi:MAG: gliding motility-associated C-terminal domain-containing protein, partial [Chitinophagales bacterium]|nr:gliding motility-associated C-terminal domain-containing protein [Chitinophagales bacterium]
SSSHAYAAAGTYSICLEQTNQAGCKGVICKTVKIVEKPQAFIPSVFSPNQDGVNDVLFVLGEEIATVEMRIYNRWGQLVFQSFSKGDGWDGTYQGTLQNVDMYIYDVQGTNMDGRTFNLKGMVALIK